MESETAQGRIKRKKERKMTYINDTHKLIRRIPKGKVTTYGSIAKVLGINPRMVGYALHQNKSFDVPCHRVVNREGRIASGFAFGGPMEQKRRLLLESVAFKSEFNVDLEKCFVDL